MKNEEQEAQHKECSKCELYGECDHLGAYKKDGKWCYEKQIKEEQEANIDGCFTPKWIREKRNGEAEPQIISPIQLRINNEKRLITEFLQDLREQPVERVIEIWEAKMKEKH